MIPIIYATASSSIGWILVAHAHSTAVVSDVCLGDAESDVVAELHARYPSSSFEASGSQSELSQLIRHVENPEVGLHLASQARGTDFQQRVWQAIRQIGVGDTSTYGEIATAIGEPKSVRAVAQACGANPLAILTPCHRVVRSDGSLSGYRWGDARKRRILDREKQVKSRHFFDRLSPAASVHPHSSASALPTTSAFAREGSTVHSVPMSVVRRIVPSELDEDKVQAFMEEMKAGDVFTPIEVIKVRANLKTDPTGPTHNFYFSLGGCHRYEATKRLGLATIRASIIEAPPSQIRVYLGASSPF